MTDEQLDPKLLDPKLLDPKLLDRVRKLLAQAEHPTTSPAEAEAFSTKAAALMARYAIDRAVLDADPSQQPATPVVRQFAVDPPYAMPRVALLDRVARAHRVRVVVGPDTSSGARLCTLVGFAVDLQLVELLFTSLLLQASRAMLAASAQTGRPKAFRRAFLLGYADAIGDRLQTARDETTAEIVRDRPSTSVVLADRSRQVDAVFDQQFPRLRSMRMTTSSAGGAEAGRRAGRNADLSARAARLGRAGPARIGSGAP